MKHPLLTYAPSKIILFRWKQAVTSVIVTHKYKGRKDKEQQIAQLH